MFSVVFCAAILLTSLLGAILGAIAGYWVGQETSALFHLRDMTPLAVSLLASIVGSVLGNSFAAGFFVRVFLHEIVSFLDFAVVSVVATLFLFFVMEPLRLNTDTRITIALLFSMPALAQTFFAHSLYKRFR